MSHSAADDFFRADAERLGYLEPGGPGFAQYYRDHGIDVPGRGYQGRLHSHLEVPMDPDTVVRLIDAQQAEAPRTGGRVARHRKMTPPQSGGWLACGHRSSTEKCPKQCPPTEHGPVGSPYGYKTVSDRHSTKGRYGGVGARAITEWSGRDQP